MLKEALGLQELHRHFFLALRPFYCFKKILKNLYKKNRNNKLLENVPYLIKMCDMIVKNLAKSFVKIRVFFTLLPNFCFLGIEYKYLYI